MSEQGRPVWAIRLESERVARGWNKADMARELLKRAGRGGEPTAVASLRRQILDWERGRHFPRDWGDAYAAAFELPREHLFSEVGPDDPAGGEEADEMRRRRLLQALGALGLSITPAVLALDEIRSTVGRTFGGEEDLSDWEQRVVEYAYQSAQRPPLQLLTDLAVDVVTVQQIVGSRRTGSQYLGWCRVASGLSLRMAKTLSNLGQVRLARDWWSTSLRAAQQSGDQELALWVAGERVIRGLYEGRPLPVLLEEANAAMRRAPQAITPARLKILASRAQVLAALGSPDAEQAMRHLVDAFERLPRDVRGDIASDLSWGEDRPAYVQAWVYAHLGDAERCSQAADHARRLYPRGHASAVAQVTLLEIQGRVRAGDVTEGIRRANEVYSSHPAEFRTVLVRTLADNVLDAVPPEHRRLGAVTDYRELLASGSGSSLV